MHDHDWFDPVEVANEAIAAAARVGSSVSHLKLQKLLYIAHGVHLAALNSGLVRGGFQAWQFGPVSPDVYHAAKSYGAYELPGFIGHQRMLPVRDPRVPDAQAVIEMVVNHYRDTTAMELVDLTHQLDTPWHKVVSEANGIPWARRISDDEIRAYYHRQLT